MDGMREIDPQVKASSAWVVRVILIATFIGVLVLMVGCAANPYQTNHSAPFIQFSHEGKKPVVRSPRAIYFDDRGIDNLIPLGICVA